MMKSTEQQKGLIDNKQHKDAINLSDKLSEGFKEVFDKLLNPEQSKKFSEKQFNDLKNKLEQFRVLGVDSLKKLYLNAHSEFSVGQVVEIVQPNPKAKVKRVLVCDISLQTYSDSDTLHIIYHGYELGKDDLCTKYITISKQSTHELKLSDNQNYIKP